MRYSGVKEVLDSTCNMLSAQSNIPQTILFGRSPAGMNSTGESDLENYYNSVEHIQTKMLYRNFKKTIDLILLSMLHKGEIEELLDSIPAEDLFDNYTENNSVTEGETLNSGNIFEKGDFSQFAKDGSDETPAAAAVIVLNKDGNVLCGIRSDNNLICGPGGHIEDGEAPIQAAIREAQEEFNITPTSIVPLTVIGENKDGQHKTSVFLCNAFEGNPKCDEEEMHSAMFLPVNGLLEHFADKLFAPFKESLLIYQKVAQTGQHSDIENSDESGIINGDEFKESDHPRDENGQFAKVNSSSSSNTERNENSSNSSESEPEVLVSESPTRNLTRFKTVNGVMKITADTEVIASKSGKQKALLKSGSDIYNVYSFAGKGSNESLVVAGIYANRYGGEPKDWSHKAGYTVVIFNGKEQYAELHWFEHDKLGQTPFKIKKR